MTGNDAKQYILIVELQFMTAPSLFDTLQLLQYIPMQMAESELDDQLTTGNVCKLFHYQVEQRNLKIEIPNQRSEN